MGMKNVRIRVKPPIVFDDEADDDPAEAPAAAPAKGSAEGPAERSGSEPGRKPDGKRPGRRRSRRRGEGRSGAREPRAERDEPAREVDPEAAESVRAAAAKMISLMGVELEVGLATDGGIVELTFEGPDKELLGARDGELASALQFLLNRMSRRAWPGAGRIRIEGDARSRPRDEEIASIARKIAKQVAKTGKTRSLRPMNAYERRIVHLTVREFTGLSSSSDGDGALKRIRISKISNRI